MYDVGLSVAVAATNITRMRNTLVASRGGIKWKKHLIFGVFVPRKSSAVAEKQRVALYQNENFHIYSFARSN